MSRDERLQYLRDKLDQVFEQAEFADEVARDCERQDVALKIRSAMNSLGGAIAELANETA